MERFGNLAMGYAKAILFLRKMGASLTEAKRILTAIKNGNPFGSVEGHLIYRSDRKYEYVPGEML